MYFDNIRFFIFFFFNQKIIKIISENKNLEEMFF